MSKRLKLVKRLLDLVLNVVSLKDPLKDKDRKVFCPMQVLHKKPEFSKEGVSLSLIHPKPLPVSLSVRFSLNCLLKITVWRSHVQPWP